MPKKAKPKEVELKVVDEKIIIWAQTPKGVWLPYVEIDLTGASFADVFKADSKIRIEGVQS